MPALTAVQDVSFQLHKGEVLGLLGPNGAGKTTIIQMLLGLLTPSSGNIQYFGLDLHQNRSAILSQISSASAYLKLPGSSTIYESMDVFGRLYGLSAQQRALSIEEKLRFFNMWNVRHQKVFGLSAGQMTRAMLAKAFLHNPKVVLLDEPTASLDPDIALEVREFIREQQKSHQTSVLLTSHNMVEVEEICNRVLVLKQGQIIASQTPQALASSVSLARLQLVLGTHLEPTIQYATSQGLSTKQIGPILEIEMDESAIAVFLMALSKMGILYTQISIEKPTLEDYFLHVAHSSVAT